LNAQAGEFLAHASYHYFRIHCSPCLLDFFQVSSDINVKRVWRHAPKVNGRYAPVSDI